MFLELDLTNGGRPVLKIDADTTRDGERMLYLQVRAHVPGFRSTRIKEVFLGLTPGELTTFRQYLERLEAMHRADGGV